MSKAGDFDTLCELQDKDGEALRIFMAEVVYESGDEVDHAKKVQQRRKVTITTRQIMDDWSTSSRVLLVHTGKLLQVKSFLPNRKKRETVIECTDSREVQTTFHERMKGMIEFTGKVTPDD